jgi:hypothetical protein
MKNARAVAAAAAGGGLQRDRSAPLDGPIRHRGQTSGVAERALLANDNGWWWAAGWRWSGKLRAWDAVAGRRATARTSWHRVLTVLAGGDQRLGARGPAARAGHTLLRGAAGQAERPLGPEHPGVGRAGKATRTLAECSPRSDAAWATAAPIEP